MKRLTIILALLLLVISNGCLAGQKLTAKDKLCKEDFEINGIRLERPINEAISKIGRPNLIEKLTAQDDIFEKRYQFDKISLLTLKYSKTEEIGYIKIEKENIETYRGIKIGDNKNDVFYRYGKQEIDNPYGFISYESPFEIGNFVYKIGFVIKEDKVKQILIFLAPTT